MTFDYPGYKLLLIQTCYCRDGSAHLFTRIYKFYSPVTKYFYILRAEYHREDIFVVKFYAKPHRKSEHKYRKVVNRGDLGNILITCVKAIPVLLSEYPTASFGLIGSPSIDKRSKKIENYINNQRFKVYAQIAAEKIGSETFTHLKYTEISGYLLLNNACGDVDMKEKAVRKMFSETYNSIPY